MKKVWGAETDSPFLDQALWVDQTTLAIAIRDKYPVTLGHTLIIPKRMVQTVFELSENEFRSCWRLLVRQRLELQRTYRPDGFNIGINDGVMAGQTVMHAHIHLIPRYAGDHPNPRGGVRSVLPGKADY